MNVSQKPWWAPRADNFFARRGRHEDYPEVLRLLNEAGLSFPNASTPRFDIINAILAFEIGEAVQSLRGILLHSPVARKTYIDLVLVNSFFRKQGWGTYLVCTSLLKLYHEGVDELQARVPRENVPWLRKMSFVSVGSMIEEKDKVLFMFTKIEKALQQKLQIPKALL